MSVTTISPQEVAVIRSDGVEIELIDVRTPMEFRAVHAAYARNVPLDALMQSDVVARLREKPATLYVICESGTRGRQACERLAAAGLTHVVNVEGGTTAWVAGGLPVTRGRRSVSLERQVRVAAGGLVVLGVVLGWLVHPVGLALAGFVGAGLVFAGVTDTCGMGMLLNRMPWNRARDATVRQ